MRGAIAKEKSDRERWDLKYAAGGLVDLEFIAQFLQLVHRAPAARYSRSPQPRALLDKAWQLKVLPVEEAEILRQAVQFYHDLTQSCGCAWQVRSIPRPRAQGCCVCWRVPPTCRISPRSMRH
ncbi:MAG: hypothetical protein WDN48_04300 [Pseudolabrys sp.]